MSTSEISPVSSKCVNETDSNPVMSPLGTTIGTSISMIEDVNGTIDLNPGSHLSETDSGEKNKDLDK